MDFEVIPHFYFYFLIGVASSVPSRFTAGGYEHLNVEKARLVYMPIYLFVMFNKELLATLASHACG